MGKDLTPEERSLQNRRAALILHSKVDGADHTAPGRRAFLQSFEDKVDPERKLSPEVRAERAGRLLRAHMIGLSLKAHAARKAKKAAAS